MVRVPVWSYVISLGVVAVAFLMFVFFLDRYPPFYCDEPAFNASAARYVAGNSFVYPLHTEAPHGDEVWAYHGPFFPRMQILTFRLLGVSHWACRIPGYLGGHLAAALLCFCLLRHGLWRSSIFLALAWLGDRASQLIMLGRPDGISHLLVVLGFVLLIGALRVRSNRRLALSAGCIGMGVGFNPAAVFFGLALVVATGLWIPPKKWAAAIAAMAAGATVPAGLFLACWIPNVSASFEQFLWYVHESTRGEWVASVSERLQGVWRMAYWTKFWILALGGTVLLLLIRALVSGRRQGPALEGEPKHVIPGAALLFSLAGVGLFLNSSMHAYYFVFFTVWPVIALGAAWETGVVSRGWRRLFIGWGCVVIGAWLLSLAWNMTRFREAWLDYAALGKTGMVQDVRQHVPEDARVACDPIYFVVAHRAGLNYTPLPFYHSDAGMSVADNTWCVVGSRYMAILDRSDPGWRGSRRLVHAGVVFRDSYSQAHNYYVYGPATNRRNIK